MGVDGCRGKRVEWELKIAKLTDGLDDELPFAAHHIEEETCAWNDGKTFHDLHTIFCMAIPRAMSMRRLSSGSNMG